MRAKKAMFATAAILAVLMSTLVATSSAQDSNDPAPPPLVGNTSFPAAGEFRDLTSLQMTFSDGTFGTCTGTLIDPMWVLTAAHCVQSSSGGGPQTFASEILLVIGSVDVEADLNNPAAPAWVEVRASNGFVIFGAYNDTSFAHDVALVKLDEPSANPPRRLATTDALVNPPNGSHTDALVLGYGQFCVNRPCTGDGRGTDFRLRQGPTEIYSDSDAEDVVGGLLPDALKESTFFTIPDPSLHGGLCPGDSGGPTMVMEEGEWRVAGVNSHFFNLSGLCQPNSGDTRYVNGLADVTSNADLVSWIDQIVNAAARTCFGVATTLVGSTFGDKLIGTANVDSIHGDRGADIIIGRGSADLLCGGKAGDFISGGAGADQIIGHSGRDIIEGGSGADMIEGGSAGDTISGGTGADVIEGGTGPDEISGNGGADNISGNGGNDDLSGGKSGDRISGGKGDDKIRGNSGKDNLKGNSGDDDIKGGSAGDDINGGSGTDECEGGTGPDSISNCE